MESDTVVVESEPQNGVNCGYTFRLGERYVVYAYASAGGQLTTNMCSGTKLASDGAADLAFLKDADEGDRWRPLQSPFRVSGLRALIVLRNGQLLAGTTSGLSRWDPANESWRPIAFTSDRRTAPVRTLVQDARGAVFAGTEGGGVFASLDEGATWLAANERLTASEVFSLAVDAKGQLLAGTSAGVFRARPR